MIEVKFRGFWRWTPFLYYEVRAAVFPKMQGDCGICLALLRSGNSPAFKTLGYRQEKEQEKRTLIRSWGIAPGRLINTGPLALTVLYK
jgi:hypothetical protein